MSRRAAAIAGLVLLLTGGCAGTGPTASRVDPEAAAAVPTRTVIGPGGDGLTLVRPRVDNRDLGWFLLDSGAAGLMISRRDSRRLGLHPVGEGLANRGVPVTFVRADSFVLGPLVIRYPVLAAVDWERIERFREVFGEEFGGLVGFPVFDRAMVEVRYGKDGEPDRVLIHRRRDPDPVVPPGDVGAWERLDVVDRRPVVTARLPGSDRGGEPIEVEARLVVDTGTSTALSLDHAFAREAGILEGLAVSHGRQVTLRGPVDVLRGRLGWIEVAGQRIEDVPLVLRPSESRRSGALPGRVDGFIGRGLLTGRTVVFDYAGRRIAIVGAARREEAGRPPPDR